MCKRLGSAINTVTITALLVEILAASVAAVPTRPISTETATATAAEPAAPKDQTYVGSKICASCHFKQYVTWKKTKHADTLNLLPKENRTDGECLATIGTECH